MGKDLSQLLWWSEPGPGRGKGGTGLKYIEGDPTKLRNQDK